LADILQDPKIAEMDVDEAPSADRPFSNNRSKDRFVGRKKELENAAGLNATTSGAHARCCGSIPTLEARMRSQSHGSTNSRYRHDPKVISRTLVVYKMMRAVSFVLEITALSPVSDWEISRHIIAAFKIDEWRRNVARWAYIEV
jgi:hypothetical protein